LSRRILGLAALLLCALPACHHDGDAVLLVVVTASGSPSSVVALEVKLTGPAGTSPPQTYTLDGSTPIMFPTTLSAQLPAYATGMLIIDVRAEDAAGATVATGHEDSIMVSPGERKTVYVGLSCGGGPCEVDGGAGNDDGGPTSGGRCGNGRIDQGETCDTAIPAGYAGACPVSCDDHVACTNDTLTGTDCTAACKHTEILASVPHDGCCPAGKPADDPDCKASCGNGTVDPGETCDTGIAAGDPGACPTDDACAAGGPCVTARLIAAGSCTAVCARYPIVEQKTGDGCCPPGATRGGDENNPGDGDCPEACGDGVVQSDQETCDIGIAPRHPGACPTSCDDNFTDTTDYLLGSGCHATCAHIPITLPISGDGSCPVLPGQPANDPMPKHYSQAEDTDCAPVCGNKKVERGEACDNALAAGTPGACPTPLDCGPTPSMCLRAELVGSADDCSARCIVTEVTECSLQPDGCCAPDCTSETDADCSDSCGDGLITASKGEVCDTFFTGFNPSACPTSCAARSCKDSRLVSTGTCAAACMYMPITDFQPGDGCCALASGANFALDPDCPPVCGNGVVESPAETCDYAVPGSCPGADSCPPTLGCTRYVLKGTAGTCSATCVASAINNCVGGDGCCPAGCSAYDDSDCLVVCGNGKVEHGETCDRAITTGAPGACPHSCDDADACTLDFAAGSLETCTRACLHRPITACLSGDGCCPPGCSTTADSDCGPAHCGDGQVGAGETCDPPASCPTSCPDDGDPCTAERLIGDAASCTAACLHVAITTCVADTGDGCCPTGCAAANDWDCIN
jgi:hypothetical protein